MNMVVSALVCGTLLCLVPASEPQYRGQNIDHWRPRTQPPFALEERLEAITALQIMAQTPFHPDRDQRDQWISQEIVPTLTALLDDPEPRVRARAGNAIYWIERRDSTAEFQANIRLLKSPDPHVREKAVSFLASRGSEAEAAIPALTEMVKHDASQEVRNQAAQLLLKTGPSGIAILQSLLSEPEVEARRAAVSAFETRWPTANSRERPPSLLPRLVELLDDKDPTIRQSAAKVILYFDPRPVAVIPKLLNHSDAQIQKHAVSTLLMHWRPVPYASEVLAAVSADLSIQQRHADLIAQLGPETVPLLVKLLNDSSGRVRGRAARGLASLGPVAEEAVPALKRLLTDMGLASFDGQLVCHEAGRALRAILNDPQYTEGLPKLKPDSK